MIEIINLDGQVLYKSRSREGILIEEVAISKFPRGVYFVKIHVNEGIQTKKLLVS